MRRLLLPMMLVSPLALAACAPSVPNSGVGFGSYDAQRESALNGGAPVVAPGAQPIVGGTVTAQPIGGGAPLAGSPYPVPTPAGQGFSTDRLGAAIDRASGAAPVAGDNTGAVIGGAVGAPMDTAAGSYAPLPLSPLGANAPAAAAPAAPVAPVVPPVAPVAPPQRSTSGPNLVQYALTSSNAVGAPVYQRSSLGLRDPQKVCASYGSPDQAQTAFLEAGGPDRDRKGLDPDGDGFACTWDPTPFRNAVK